MTRRPDAVAARDRAVRAGRRIARGASSAPLGISGLFSLVAARTVRGHDPHARGDRRVPDPRAGVSVRVPGPDPIPAIAGLPPAPRAPAPGAHGRRAAPRSRRRRQPSAPAPAAPAPAPAPGAGPDDLRRLLMTAARWQALGTTAEIRRRSPTEALEAARAAVEARARRDRPRVQPLPATTPSSAGLNRRRGRARAVSPPLRRGARASRSGPPRSPTARSTPRSAGALVQLGYDRDFAAGSGRRAAACAPPASRAGTACARPRPPHRPRPRRRPIDLGATAKALAADRAARAAVERAGAGVLVNLGGDIAIAGPAPEDGLGRAGVRGPPRRRRAPRPARALHGGGLATSSTTVRRWRARPRPRPPHRRSRHGVPARRPVAHRHRRRRDLRRGQRREHRGDRPRRGGRSRRLEARALPARLVGRDGDVVHRGLARRARAAA